MSFPNDFCTGSNWYGFFLVFFLLSLLCENLEVEPAINASKSFCIIGKSLYFGLPFHVIRIVKAPLSV